MNTLQLTTSFNYACGRSDSIAAMIGYLMKRGIGVVVCCNNSERAKDLADLGIRHYILPINEKKKTPALLVFNYFRLLQIVKKEKIDVIHSHHRWCSLIAFFVARRIKIPLVCSDHNELWGKRFLTKWGDAVITGSESNREHLIRYFKLAPEKITLIPAFAEFPDEPPEEEVIGLRVKLGLEDKIVFGCVGRLAEIKNVQLLLRAAERLIKLNKGVTVLLVGDGGCKYKLVSLAKSLGIEKNVIFAGQQDKARLALYYRLFDCCVLTSDNEGTSIVLLEAMKMGVPVIATKVGGALDFIHHGENGFLIDKDDIDSLVRCMEYYLGSGQRRREMGGRGKETVLEKYNANSMADTLVEAYRKARSLYFLKTNETVKIGKIRINNIHLDDVFPAIERFIKEKKPVFIVTPNVDHIVKIQNDTEFLNVYKDASLVLPDGMPILWAAKFLKSPLKEKISGSDLFPALCAVAAERDYRIFFLGGREGSAQKAAEVLKAKHNNLKIVGYYSPPFGFENRKTENEKIINMIKEAGPDILFVGLGAPKQEKWIYKYRDRYRVPVSIGIGVSFEFVAGMIKRAPLWMQKTGLEWLWRLMMEPGRLWKRYLINDMRFFWLVFKQKLKPR